MNKEFDDFMDGVLNNHPQEGKTVFNCKIPNCPHCLEDIAQMEDDGLTDDEWLIKEKHKQIEATAIDFAKWLAAQWLPIWVQSKFMWEFDVEMPIKDIPKDYIGYKTEEELFEIYKKEKTN